MKFGLYARKSSEDSGKQVQSVDNQIEILQEKAHRDGLTISKIYNESRSAKTPGRRQQFNQMIEDLKAGKIQGIICWKLDRLSRNPLEGGIIMQHLQDDTIKRIVTYEKTYFPGDNSLLMTIELGMATEYSRALSENTKRGQTYKLKKGWYPSVAPLGYINTTDRIKGEKEIVPDPQRFHLVRKCWDLLLDGKTVPWIMRETRNFGLKVPATRSKPEHYLSLHGTYHLFRNIFYCGDFQWAGEVHKGNHQPMITKEEFEMAQELISKRNRPKKFKHDFAYTGTINCGHCNAFIVASTKNKIRKDGSINQRIYYRCSHRKAGIECNQQAIRKESLEKQMLAILDSITLPDSFVNWGIKWLHDQNEESNIKDQAILNQQKKSLEKLNNQLKALLDMKLNELIDTDTFKVKNSALLAEKRQIQKHMENDTDSQEHRIETIVEALEFCKGAKKEFEEGSPDDKKLILDTLGTKWILEDGKLSVKLEPEYTEAIELAKQDWINDPRFPTLPTRLQSGLDKGSRALIINGGGGEELPLASKSFQ